MSVDPAPKRKRPTWHWIAAGIGVLVVFSMFASMGDDDADPITNAPAASDSAANVADAPKPTDVPAESTAAPTDAPAAPPFADIEAKRVTATDLQWDAYVESLAGTSVVGWPGIAREVKASGKDYKVSVDFTPDGGLFGASDAFIETANADVVNWSKDTPVTVSGTIKRVGSMMGAVVVTFDDGVTITAP